MIPPSRASFLDPAAISPGEDALNLRCGPRLSPLFCVLRPFALATVQDDFAPDLLCLPLLALRTSQTRKQAQATSTSSRQGKTGKTRLL
jgi:hypothetical protein